MTAAALVPHGCHPSYALDYSTRDNRFYVKWDEISRDRSTFDDWIERHVNGVDDHAGYRRLVARDN